MNEYRVFVIDDDGHVVVRYEFVCANESEARQLAVDLVDGRDAELWQRAQRLATFHRQPAQ
jgi:hypothetical protein